MDCAIKEPYPFDKAIFSQKLNGPGLKYEVGVCIKTAHIVWTNGPFKAGKADSTIFSEDGLLNALADEECIEVDAGYQGNDKLKNPYIADSKFHRIPKSRLIPRHENVNKRLKQFAVLDQVFRHPLGQRENEAGKLEYPKHKICFDAVAVITQLSFEFEGELYDVDYTVTYD